MQLIPKPQRQSPTPPTPKTDSSLGLGAAALEAGGEGVHVERDDRSLSVYDSQAMTCLSDLPRVVIFIDGSNLFYAAAILGIEIDYARLLKCLTGNRRLVRAYFYTGVDPTNEKQQGFLLWMRRNGYRVVTKELVQLPDGSKKANLDVEIAVDMMQLSQYCDLMVLLSGDGDLAYAVNTIAYRGVQMEVISLRSMTSDSLINVADRYIDLETIKHELQRS